MNVYITAQRWSKSLLEALQGNASGVILGDLFCQKRMFAHEWFDVLDFSQHARLLGFDVIFQTPAYNTPRTFEATINLLGKMYSQQLLDAVLLHDIGVLHALKDLAGVEFWWDRFSFNRDIVPNTFLVEFLRKQGVGQIEVSRAHDIDDLTRDGCGVLLYGYGPDVVSFGRICYTEYFMSEPCEQKILCCQHSPYISSRDKVPLQYVADGYTLLDRKKPIHSLPHLSVDQARAISGLTICIKEQVELSEINELIRDLETLRTMPV